MLTRRRVQQIVESNCLATPAPIGLPSWNEPRTDGDLPPPKCSGLRSGTPPNECYDLSSLLRLGCTLLHVIGRLWVRVAEIKLVKFVLRFIRCVLCCVPWAAAQRACSAFVAWDPAKLIVFRRKPFSNKFVDTDEHYADALTLTTRPNGQIRVQSKLPVCGGCALCYTDGEKCYYLDTTE